MQAFWKEGCDEGGLAWDDTNNNRAFHAGEISATLNGACIYIVAKRQKEKIKDDKGEPLYLRTSTTRSTPWPAAGIYPLFLSNWHAIMKYSKNQKLAKDLLPLAAQERELREVVPGVRGLQRGRHHVWENNPMWGKIDKPLQMFRTAARDTRMFGYSGPSTAQGHRGLHQVHRHRHVREGGPGHEGRGRRQVGRGRAQEDLRGLTAGPPTGHGGVDDDSGAQREHGFTTVSRRTFLAGVRCRGRRGRASRASWPRDARRPSPRAPSSTSSAGSTSSPRATWSSSARRATPARRSAPRCVFEFINANDLQAAHHRGHAVAERARTSSRCCTTGRTSTRTGLVDVSDLVGVAGQGPGRALRPVATSPSRWAASGSPCRTASCPACRSPTGSRGSTRSEPARFAQDPRRAPPGRHEAQEEGPARSARRSAIPSATPRPGRIR